MYNKIAPLIYHTVTHPEKWDAFLACGKEWVNSLVSLTLQETLKNYPALEVSFLWTDDQTIQEHNHRYRGKNTPTNVLSFPSYDRDHIEDALKTPPYTPLPIGDIVFGYETILRESQSSGKSFEHHLSHLCVHGVLHLLGYDHEEENEAHQMETCEINILSLKSIPNPYDLCHT